MLGFLRKEAAPLGVAAGTRAGFFLAALLALSFIGPARPGTFLLHGGAPHPVAAVDLFQRWDAYWFLNIAREGYQFHGVQSQVGQVPLQQRETNITPFPLYPLSIGLLSLLLGDRSVSGLLISLACFMAASVMLHRLWREREGPALATRALLLFSLTPGAFIYGAIYSESLFLLLSLLCLTQAARGRPLAAGFAGLGASATRLAGLLLAPAILFQLSTSGPGAGRRGRTLNGLLAAALAASGAGIYFIYLFRLTGDPLAYFTAQQGWHKLLTAPWTALAGAAAQASSLDPVRLLQLSMAALFMALTVAALRTAATRAGGSGRVTMAEGAYLVLGLLMPLCSSNLLGLPRYLMVLYPVYPVLARWTRATPILVLSLVAMAAVNMPLLAAWLGWSHSL